MAWLANVDLVQAANAIVTLIVGLAVGLGFRNGRRQQPQQPQEQTVAVAGALVDSASVKLLTAALEAHTLESIAARKDRERDRRLGHEMVEAVEGLSKEMLELRSEVRLHRRN